MNYIFNRQICQMIYTNMIGAMQYSTKGVNNDYVLCVSGYLPLHITYSYLPKVLPTTT